MGETLGRTAGVDKLLRGLFWSAAALLLLVAVAAGRFSPEFNWTVFDFAFAGFLLAIVGVAFEVTTRNTRSWTHRFAIGLAVLAGLLIAVSKGAVGMIGDEDNPHNILFLALLGLAIAGATAVGFRASGLAFVMLAAGVIHASIALAGMAIDPRGAIVSTAFGCLWLVSAGLFRKAAQDTAAPGQ